MENLIKIIFNQKKNYDQRLNELEEYIYNSENLINLIENIKIIPEKIKHDSTEEKLWAKSSDIILSKSFISLGLKSNVIQKRSNSADIIANSIYHNYSLVADAKAFRLSRTAKNQKDYKVVSLSNWRQDAEYAILCAPYFQYPFGNSQIYEQALKYNVCLLSWEHIVFLLKIKIHENDSINFNNLWNYSYICSTITTLSDSFKCFIPSFNLYISEYFKFNLTDFYNFLKKEINFIFLKGKNEIDYWEEQIIKINQYSREKAIKELLNEKKINRKISQISKFIHGLNNDIPNYPG